MINKTYVYSISNIAVKILLLSTATVLPSLAQDHIILPMVNIPTGTFMMGSESGTASSKPMHSVSIQAFQMGKYPVTVAEFRKFADINESPKEHFEKDSALFKIAKIR